MALPMPSDSRSNRTSALQVPPELVAFQDLPEHLQFLIERAGRCPFHSAGRLISSNPADVDIAQQQRAKRAFHTRGGTSGAHISGCAPRVTTAASRQFVTRRGGLSNGCVA